MTKLPIVIPYKDSENGQELRYAIRSFKNIDNWNGEVILIGDCPIWFNGTHHTIAKQTNPYLDVYKKFIKATTLYDRFIWSNDDIYITEPTTINAYYTPQIDSGTTWHKQMLINTKDYLTANGHTAYNYDLHTPIVIESELVKNIPPVETRQMKMHWRSLYGNINKIGGEVYYDKKSQTSELLEGKIISTRAYTSELQNMFTEPSKFEVKNKLKIAALVHYYIEDHGSGGELYIHGLFKELAKKHEMVVFVTDDNLPNTTIDGVQVMYTGDIRKYKYDILITHFQNTSYCQRLSRKDRKPMVTIVHNNMRLTKQFLRTNRGLIVYNSQWVKNHHKKPGIVLTPPIKKVTATPGDKVLLVNLIPEKGSDTFFELARQMPHIKFLGVKGGYYKQRQLEESLPNLEIIENTDDMNAVYNQTKVVLMPSSYESYGMVAAEAAQVGIPTIAHPTPGLLENLGEAGIFIDREDVEAYRAEIDKLYSDKKYYKQQSKKSKERHVFNMENQALDKAISAIEELV